MSKIIALPIETIVRELDSKLLLTFFLIKNGYDVLIGPRGSIFFELKFLRNTSLLYKSLSIDQKDVMASVVKNGGKNYILDEEANVFSKNQDSIIKSIFPKNMLDFVDIFFLSGEKIKNLVNKNRPEIPNEKLIISGHPRFEFFKKPYMKYYNNVKDELQNKYKDYILFNLNFSMGNPYRGWDEQISYLNNHPDFNLSYINDIKNKMLWQKKNMKEYVKAVILIAKKYPEINIIIRPHPSENENYYKPFFNKFQNIFIIRSGNVLPWIYASKVSVHYDCTTGIESVLNGKPSISFTCNRDEKLVNWLSPYVCNEVSTINQLLCELDTYLNNNEKFSLSQEKSEMLNSYIANQSIDSINTICNAIVSHNQKSTSYYTNTKSRVLLRFKKRLGKYRRIFFNKDEYTHHFKNLNKKDVLFKLNKFKEITGLEFDFEIKNHGIDTYLISRTSK